MSIISTTLIPYVKPIYGIEFIKLEICRISKKYQEILDALIHVLNQHRFEPPEPRKSHPKRIALASKVEHIIRPLLGNISIFLSLQEVNALVRVNKAWKKALTVDMKRFPCIDRIRSLLIYSCVQNALYNSEANPMTSERIIRLAKIERLLLITILPFSHIHHFKWTNQDYLTSIALQKRIKQIPLDLHSPDWWAVLRCSHRLSIPQGELYHYKKAVDIQIEGHGLAQLTNFTELRSLELVDEDGYQKTIINTLTNADFAQVRRLARTLESLTLHSRITDVGLQQIFLDQFTALKHLKFYEINITDEGLNALSGLVVLQELSFFSCKIRGVGLAALGQLNELQALTFATCYPITTAKVAQLAHLPKLQNLSLTESFRSRFRDLEQLDYFTLLQKLKIYGCEELTDDQLGPLAKLTQLHSLDISWCRKITGLGLMQLTGLTALRILDISHTKIDEKSLNQFLNHCPTLNIRNVIFLTQ